MPATPTTATGCPASRSETPREALGPSEQLREWDSGHHAGRLAVVSEEGVAAEDDSALPRPGHAPSQQSGSGALLVVGALSILIGYYVPMATVEDGSRHTYSLSNMAHYGTPGTNLICGGAAVLALACVVLMFVGETRYRLIGVLALTVAEAIGVVAVTGMGLYLLPVYHGTYRYEAANVSFGPAVPTLIAAVTMALTGALWWCLQTWTGTVTTAGVGSSQAG